MILSVKDTFGKTVRGTDGDIGVVKDIFFDDDLWTIRYLVVETGDWLNGREVLVSPASKQQGGWEGRVIAVQLSRDQVRNGPDIDTKKPISRQLEIEFNRYYRLPFYWGGDAIFGQGMTPGAEAAARIAGTDMEDRERAIEAGRGVEESHLRSAQVTIGYAIRARDGDAGKLDDFLYDGETLRINYMVLDTGGMFGGRKVTIPPTWVTKVDFTEKHIYVNLNRETIKNSPDFDLETLNRDARQTAKEK